MLADDSTIRGMSKIRSPLNYFLISVIGVVLLTFLGPQEQSLGSNVRIVYLHGVWVLTAEIAFLAAGLSGLLGLLLRRDRLHAWSAALAQGRCC